MPGARRKIARAGGIRPTPKASGNGVSAVPRVLKIVGSIVVPTTLLTALMLYFGRLHGTGPADYFRVRYTVLDLTAQDYLVRSADGLIPPLVVIAGAALLALWAHQVLTRALPAEFRYDGLKMVLQSGNQYLLLPAGWTPADGAAILAPRTDTTRLEFSRSADWRNPAC